jgi:hypothetical protein
LAQSTTVLGEAVLDELHVAAFGVVEAHRLADARLRPRGQGLGIDDTLLDFALDVIGQLEPVRTEELDAVVLKGIVRGADHDPGIGAHAGGDEGDGRRRQRADQHDVGAGGDDARLERTLEHVAGQAGVLADHHPAALVALAEVLGHRATERQRHLGSHGVLVRDTADAVRAEQPALRARLGHGGPHSNAFRWKGEPLRWRRPP